MTPGACGAARNPRHERWEASVKFMRTDSGFLLLLLPKWRASRVLQEPKFWDAYRKTPAWEFARFLALADKGAPHASAPPPATKEAGVELEREDLEASIRFAHQELGI